MSNAPAQTPRKKLFCFGYGYTCEYLVHDLMNLPEIERWEIAGTTRDEEKRNTLIQHNIKAHIFDYAHPLADPANMLKDVTHILISTPPDDEGDIAFLMHAEHICNIPTIEWVGYLSTTAVYGDRNGEWVDEDTPVSPTAQRGAKRIIAEQQWLSLLTDKGLPVHIFRLAGIYGPGRSALDSIRAGVARRIDKPGQAFSRIHVEDIVQVLKQSMRKPNPGRLYNVADDLPVPSHEVIAYACDLIGKPKPPLIPYAQADLAPITRSFYADNKRVKNERIKRELGIDLKYKTYKEGLKACLDAEDYAISLFRVNPY